MDKIENILELVSLKELSIEDARNQILKLFKQPTEEVVETKEEPKIIGKLNREFGYNGFEKIEVGADVYFFKDKFCFKTFPLNGDEFVYKTFYKETLTPHINFL